MKNIKHIKTALRSLLTGCALLTLASLPLSGNAQQVDPLNQAIQSLGELDDPSASKKAMKQIIKKFGLKADADAETIDRMKGHIALDYIHAGDYKRFDKTIRSMANKFNQTSYMNMAVSALLQKGADADDKKAVEHAETIARKTLERYHSFKDDPSARPADFQQEHWDRFMNFATYPYHDAYAAALYASGKYEEALAYQEKAFDGPPEEGMTPSVERYAQLLALNGQEDKAYTLLVKMAETGKSSLGMDAQLKDLYIKKHGEAGYDAFALHLQGNVVARLKEEFRAGMLDEEAPDFALLDLNGQTVRLSDFLGQAVVIDFWATWCAPCKASFPAMVKAQEQHPGVKFLFIATQEKPEGAEERVRNYIEETGYPFHVLMDQSSADDPRAYQVVSAYGVQGIPTKIFVDAGGKLRFRSVGFTTDSELLNEMEAMISLLHD